MRKSLKSLFSATSATLLAMVAGAVNGASGVQPAVASGWRGKARPKDKFLGGPSSVGNKAPSRRDRHRAAVAAAKRPAPGPKFPKDRKRRVCAHPLRDEHGAYTLVGAADQHSIHWPTPGRRKWLAGISAQRGY